MSGLRFPKEEFTSRVKIVRGAMEREGIEVLAVFSSPGSMRYGQRGHVMYLSGYEPYFGNTMMILPLDVDLGAVLMIDSADFFPSDCTWIDVRKKAQDPVALIRQYLDENRLGDASVGIAGEYSVDPKLVDGLRLELRGNKLAFASKILERARSVKSPYEIGCISDAVAIAEKGFEALREHARAGVSERTLVAEMEKACREAGSEAFPHHTMVTFGSDPKHLDWWWYCGDRKLAEGDLFNVDTGMMSRGYCCDMSRSLSLGPVPPPNRAAYRVLADAFEAARKQCRPGVAASAVNEAVAEVMAEEFEGDFSGVGHGIGLEVHEWPFVGYEYIRNDPIYEDSVLEEGMVLSIEPQITLPKAGDLQLEDEVVVSSSGGKRLSTLRQEIIEC
ncbi:MAG: aminopeptidase P family protein [Methanobacteriota archaeon]|nr:MAG: aminopeptidase P family protein [Euryarchaeota archaeon]